MGKLKKFFAAWLIAESQQKRYKNPRFWSRHYWNFRYAIKYVRSNKNQRKKMVHAIGYGMGVKKISQRDF